MRPEMPLEPLAEQKGFRFQTLATRVPASLSTDPRKLRQILVNLLGNAVKFTEAGEVRLEIEEQENEVLLHVHDTGVGIAPEHAEKLFEPFWQADPSNRRVAGGTGLGLAVSRRLALLRGGDLTVQSKPGQGSTFTLPPQPA